MSKSSEIKERFLSKTGKSRCCQRAFASGLAAASVSDGGVLRLSSDRAELAEKMANAISAAFRGEAPRILTAALGSTVQYRTPALVSYVSALDTDPAAPIVIAKCQDCRAAFLRGLFVGAGRYSTTERGGFRLEFSVAFAEARLSRILSEFSLSLGRAVRRKEILLYTSSSTAIQDFFGMLGDTDTYFSLANDLVRREIRNDTNRIYNCEMNNIKKAVDAAENQLSAITYLAEAGMLESMPEELAETARLRIRHPDLSLSQLAALTVPRISKPGLSHRLRRLVSIADEHRSRGAGDREKKGGRT